MTAKPARENPFPGPQPYRAADRERFYGRDAIVTQLSNQLLARSSTTLYGPSGAGKSSLMQAGVIPRLQESHDFLVVRVDGWPPGEAPLPWLVRALFADLDLGEQPADKTGLGALEYAMDLSSRRSDQPILIYLDQLEQLLFPGRDEAEAEALIAGIEWLARAPIQGLQIVLALREDYLGRFRDRARDKRELLAHGFRLGPMTVGEMVKAVCRAAADGIPPQRWDEQQIRGLMCEVRIPGHSASDEAEVQAAYAQIVCRALFQARAQDSAPLEGAPANAIPAEPEAELILRRYLDATLEELGSLAPDARRLLENHLITADGSRTLRTEKELLRLLPPDKLAPILKALESAAILHAEAHQGSRYFEIGHDWLARKVHEERQTRERDEEQAEALRRQRAEADARLEKARAQRRSYAIIALVSLVFAAVATIVGIWALAQQKRAEDAGRTMTVALEKAQVEERRANDKAIEALDARLLAGFRELKSRGQLAWGTKLLLDIKRPDQASGWITLASDALASSALEATLIGHKQALTAAAWSPNGDRVVTASADLTARLWAASGAGDPIVLSQHRAPVTAVAFSPDGKRLLTASADGTVLLWNADGSGAPTAIEAPGGAVLIAAWSPNSERIVTASADHIARVWSTGGEGGDALALRGHTGPLTAASFLSNDSILTASEDGTARVWSAKGGAKPFIFDEHKGAIYFAAASPDGARIVTASADATARVWRASGKGKTVVLRDHDGAVVHAAWSPDGERVATASADRTARLWKAGGDTNPIVFNGHTTGLTHVAFRPDGRYLATASLDRTARLWPVDGGEALELRGHDAPVRSVEWSPDGSRVLTLAGAEEGARSLDHTARVWRPGRLESLPRERKGFFHSASISAAGDLVASAYDDSTGRVWRADGRGDPIVVTASGHSAWVAGASLSPDGARIATASFDMTARIARVDGAGDPIVLKGHLAAVRAVAWSPDGKRVVTTSDDKMALVHSLDGGGAPKPLAGHTDSVRSAAWSPDGSRIITASLDRTARIFQADGSGEPLVLRGHTMGVSDAAWSVDGERVLTVSPDNTVKIWSAKTGAMAASLDQGSHIFSAAWSPDGKRIATSTADDGLRVQSADGTGEPLLLDMPEPVIAMAFLDGGKRLFTVASDNTTRAFTIDIDALKQGLERANADCLPPDKRATYLGEGLADARNKYDACERSHGRTPGLGEGARPGEAGPAAASASAGKKAGPSPQNEVTTPADRRAFVFVIPGDAVVELDGRRLLRTNGVIELPGDVDAEVRLRIFRGTKSFGEKVVVIKDAGASPSRIDLNEMATPATSAAAGSRPAVFPWAN